MLQAGAALSKRCVPVLIQINKSVLIPMENCISSVQLSDLLAGQLEPELENELNQHLLVCKQCCKSLDQMIAVPDNLRAVLPAAGQTALSDASVDHLLSELKGRVPGSRLPAGDTKPAKGQAAGEDTTPDVSAVHHPAMPEISGYEVLEEVARGGMGVIYKAIQRTPNRVVAIKMMKSGQFADREEVYRFRKEAEAAAKLEHPRIVPIYEVGDSSGSHYYTMRFIPGCSLDDRLKDGPLSPRAAATLVKKIAEAVQFAHENSIVHRDLKPGNILIDEQNEPKVTDFGLARDTAIRNHLTNTGEILGTPSYMSPEQATGKAEAAGPLVDIYSLGAILYAALTGRPPFQAASAVETLRQVTESEPVSARTLNAEVDRDLETICLKCLDKAPQRRYASAQELADELTRFLENKPILARPAGHLARAARWCKRNPLGAAVASLLLLISVISPIVAFNQLRLADSARKANGALNQSLEAEIAATSRAKDNAERAATNLEYADEVVRGFVLEIGNGAGVLSRQPDTMRLRKKLLTMGRDYYNKLIEENPDSQLDQRLANANFELAAILSKLSGETEQAISAYKRALSLYNELAQESPSEKALAIWIGNIHCHLGGLYHATGETELASEAFTTGLNAFKRLASEHPRDLVLRHNVATTLIGQAQLCADTGNQGEAISLLMQCRDICEQLVAFRPKDLPLNTLHATCLSRLAATLDGTEQPAACLAATQAALEKSEGLLKQHPRDFAIQSIYSTDLHNLGVYYQRQGELRKAIDLMNKSLELNQDDAEQNPGVLSHEIALATNVRNLGDLHRRTENFAQALQFYTRAGNLLGRLADENLANAQLRADATECQAICVELRKQIAQSTATEKADTKSLQSNLAPLVSFPEEDAEQYAAASKQIEVVARLKDVADQQRPAMVAAQSAVTMLEQLTSESVTSELYLAQLAYTLFVLGYLHEQVLEPQKASLAFEQAEEVLAKLVRTSGGHPVWEDRVSVYLVNLGVKSIQRGEIDVAIRFTRDAVQIKEVLVDNYPNNTHHQVGLANAQINLASLVQSQQPNEALHLASEAVAKLQEIVDNEPNNSLAVGYMQFGQRELVKIKRALAEKTESG